MRFTLLFRIFGMALPTCLTLFLMAISILPFPFIQGLNPWLGLLSILFWAQFQPKAMPWWLALGLGAVHDLWTNMPLPTALFVFPFCVLVLHRWRLLSPHYLWYFINIPVILGVFFFALIVWVGSCLSLKLLLSPAPVLWTTVLSLVLYPIIHNFLLIFYPMTLQTTSYRAKF